MTAVQASCAACLEVHLGCLPVQEQLEHWLRKMPATARALGVGCGVVSGAGDASTAAAAAACVRCSAAVLLEDGSQSLVEAGKGCLGPGR